MDTYREGIERTVGEDSPSPMGVHIRAFNRSLSLVKRLAAAKTEL